MASNSFLQSLISPLLLCSVALFIAVATAQSDDFISFAYDFYGLQPTDLTYQGDAHFPSDTTYLRLTKTDSSGRPTTNSTGRILHSTPVKFWKSGLQADFETTITFIIKPNKGDEDPGDGLTFFIAPVGSTPGAAGGWLGIFNDSTWEEQKVFAVEFDIYFNPEVDPYPFYRHVGIDIETPVSIIDTEVGDAILGQEVTVHIDYKGASNMISVQGNAGSKRFEVSYEYDLRYILDQQVQVGISAATGGAVAVFDVISWYFTSILVDTGGSNKDDGHIRQFV